MKKKLSRTYDYEIAVDNSSALEVIKSDGAVERSIVATISESSVDRVKDRVMPGAFVNLEKQVPVLWSHQRDELPIGKTLWNKNIKTRRAVKSKILFAPTAKALETYELITGGFLTTVSVGMSLIDYEENSEGGIDINKAELLEVSLVNVPANRNAVIEGIKSLYDKGITFTDSTLTEFGITIVDNDTPEKLDAETPMGTDVSRHCNLKALFNKIKESLIELEKQITNTPDDDEVVAESDDNAATSGASETSDDDEESEPVAESGIDAATSDCKETDSEESFTIVEDDKDGYRTNA